jgi:glycosyltransferase involved in cell wall biosynthesis
MGRDSLLDQAEGFQVIFRFYSEPTFEKWNWTNPDTQGIGGSETSHIEMCRRLAERGHKVYSYAPMYEPIAHGPAGVLWQHSETCKFWEPTDVWVIYRYPQAVDLIPHGANIWLICQDVDYPKTLTFERAKRFSRIVALCQAHADFLKKKYPPVADRVCVSSNGIKREIIEEVATNPPVRNPRRLIYASSPDRGMEYLLDIFPRAKEIVPDLELHLYYGFDNIEKLEAKYGPDHFISRNAMRLRDMMNQPGVVMHGRTAQPDLIREWFKSGIWCHPSEFTETSCITSMDAQACGAIPITTPTWAVGENVKHGIFIEGNIKSDLTHARYALQLASLALQPEEQDKIRAEMMTWARKQFDWERVVDQWANWAWLDSQAGRRIPEAEQVA